LSHGIFFPTLGDKVVVVAHDGVDRYSMRAFWFAQSAGMAAVEASALSFIGSQKCNVDSLDILAQAGERTYDLSKNIETEIKRSSSRIWE